ncbi:lipopolysaccharide biosynthesis protein [uncultured Slackia sp.]|uniref:lipopolysaccharide biosynthesis protein n=1 Tax=uncultured Slackia sp. TaxID=665903 RepID=UPI0025DC2384|nr:lipopolysaccharide biosynthesis protein [uncultured Slackia sp.]
MAISLKKAAVFQFAAKYYNYLLQIVLTIVLARLIGPDEFGLVAIVTVFLNLFFLLSDCGLSPAIVRYQELDNKDHNALFTFSGVIGIALSLLFLGVSPVISFFYQRDELTPLLTLSAISILFNSLNMVPNGILIKEKRFDLLSMRLVIVSSLTGFITVGLAFFGFGVYALVLQTLLNSMLVFVWNYMMTPIKFGEWRFVKQVKKVFKYSTYQFLYNLISFFSGNLPNMVLGKAMDPYRLGLYDRAFRLSSYPAQALGGVAGSVLQPYLRDLDSKRQELYLAYIRLQKILVLIGAPISVFLLFSAREIILIMYGPNWVDAAIPFALLSISVVFKISNCTIGPLLQSTGDTEYLFREGVIATAITAIFLCVGVVTNELSLVALCVSLAYVLHTVPCIYYTIHKVFNQPVAKYVRLFAPEALACLLYCVAIYGFIQLGASRLGTVIWFLLKIVALALVFCVVYFICHQFTYFSKNDKKGKQCH